jgi:hypothetical protein
VCRVYGSDDDDEDCVFLSVVLLLRLRAAGLAAMEEICRKP